LIDDVDLTTDAAALEPSIEAASLSSSFDTTLGRGGGLNF